MALDFNNQAAAENYALRESMKLLMDSNMNFLASNKPEVNADNKCGSLGMAKRKAFRNMVIQMVLATDMSRHFDLVSHFTAQVVQNKELRAKATSAQMWASMNHAQRLLTLQVALKVCNGGGLRGVRCSPRGSLRALNPPVDCI